MKEFFSFVWRESTEAECHEVVCRLVRENAIRAALQADFDDAAKASSKQLARDEQVQWGKAGDDFVKRFKKCLNLLKGERMEPVFLGEIVTC